MISTIYKELLDTRAILGMVISDCPPKIDFENKALVFDSLDDLRIIAKELSKVCQLKDEISKRADVLNSIFNGECDE